MFLSLKWLILPAAEVKVSEAWILPLIARGSIFIISNMVAQITPYPIPMEPATISAPHPANIIQ